MTAHATLSPSSAARWIACPAAPHMEAGRPDESSPAAAEGTAAHSAAALAIMLGLPVAECPLPPELAPEDAPLVQQYVDYVRHMAEGCSAQFEVSLPIGQLTGEAGAVGTADAIVFAANELVIVDFKFGRVRVPAERNPQLMLYALAALRLYSVEVEDVRLVVHQPSAGGVDEWLTSVDELQAWGEQILPTAERALALARGFVPLELADFNPCEDACRYCRAKAVCPALATKVQEEVGADLAQLTHECGDGKPSAECVQALMPTDIARVLPAVPLIESWCKAVNAEALRLLTKGEPVQGYKLVAGRRGARAWGDATAAEEAMRAMRLPDFVMYERKLITPTAADKLHKNGDIGPRQWKKLQVLITQKEGEPCVAPEADARPAISHEGLLTKED